jgi:ketosteroid isomerase-like protein
LDHRANIKIVVSNFNQGIMNVPKNNKEIVTKIFTELSKGNDEPLLDAMSEDMQWNWMGSGQWSRSFVGKSEVLNDLWKNVRATIKQPYKVLIHRIIADGDNVVVEMTGQNETNTDRDYKNNYCWICRLKDGKLCEINEYMDTELVTKAFSQQTMEIIGHKFMVDFGMAKSILHFKSRNELHFRITEMDGKPTDEAETVSMQLTELRPNLYMATWKEKNGNTITQVQDFEKEIIYSNWTLPNGQFENVKGTIKPIEKE